MAHSKTGSFITELPLKVDSVQKRELDARFQAARQIYNNCLNEAMVRVGLVRNSEPYQAAKKSRDALPERLYKKQRAELFKQARVQNRYSEYDLQAYAARAAKDSKWIAEKIDANTQQTIATRAFRASEKVILGRAKKVRYKGARQFKSVEGKTIKQGLRWKNDSVVWGKLVLIPCIDWENPVIRHGVESPVKYVRLIRRELNGKRRWYVQLINEGVPYQKPQNYSTPGIIGLDLNISNVAFVADKKAGLLPFVEGVSTFQAEISRLQSKMERSRRATNPDIYEPDFQAKRGNSTVTKKGKAIKGKRQRIRSKTYLKTAAKKRELERRKTAYAKSQNRKLTNEILRHGNQIKTERVSVKGWQNRYGKAIYAKSPGYFQSELKRKAESAGGSFTTFSTQKTALSQTNLTGERIKKYLSERVHKDRSGIKVMHRDLFSAYLSRHVNQDMLSLQDACNEYLRTEPFLLEAWKDFQTNREQVSSSERRKTDSSSERFSIKLGTDNQISCKAGAAPPPAGLKSCFKFLALIPVHERAGSGSMRNEVLFLPVTKLLENYQTMLSTHPAGVENSGRQYLPLPPTTGRSNEQSSLRSPNQELLPLTSSVNNRDCLEIGGCEVKTLVEQFGSPLYIVDEETLRTACRQYREACNRYYAGESQVLYASKAWSCLAICAIVRQEGLGIDVVSAGELYTALQAGMSPSKIYLHGNNKSPEELYLAVESGCTIVVDNWLDLHTLANFGLGAAGREIELQEQHNHPTSKVRIMLRLTPGIECHTHEYIRTGHLDSKFGFDPNQMDEVFAFVSQHPIFNCIGLHAHIGSQIFESQPHQDLAEVMVEWLGKAVKAGLPISELNVGGGLGIRYTESDDPPTIEEWVKTVSIAITDACNAQHIPLPKLLCEPGRSLIGSACVTAYTIGSQKVIPQIRTYVAVDGGMSDNPRPITYQSLYRAVVANQMSAPLTATVTIAGKHCESGDILIKNAQMPETKPGDILVVMGTGAYNYSMASNYNRLPRPAAVLVRDGDANLILQRETYQDLIRQDLLPDRLQG